MRLKLASLLEERGINPYQLSKGIGVSHPSVSAWLNGRMRGDRLVQVYPDYDSLEDLCLFLECTPNDLLEIEHSAGTTWRDVGESRRGRPPKAANEVRSDGALMRLLHATLQADVESIMATGLDPSKCAEGRTYLAMDEKTAYRNAFNAKGRVGGDYALLEVSIALVDQSRLEEKSNELNHEHFFAYPLHIPPAALSVVGTETFPDARLDISALLGIPQKPITEMPQSEQS